MARRKYRCRWCGKELYATKGKRIPKHKTHPSLPKRSDGLCSGSQVLIKFLKPEPVATHPQALASSPKKRRKVKHRG